MSTLPPPPWPLTRTLVCMGVLVLLLEGLLLFAGNGGVLHGSLLDPDCYMHLQRALRLMTGGWQPGGFDPRVNAPFGFAIHWTSLFDSLLVAGARVLTVLGLTPRDALYLWGSLISPLLLVLALGVFAAGVRPWVHGPLFLWLTVLLFTQPQLSGAFFLGRVDHHSLILGLMLVQLAWLFAISDGRALRTGLALPLALAAGAAAGVQLCTTIEALLTILFVSLVLALAWTAMARPVLGLLTAYWGACLGIVLAWLLLTRGPQFFEPLYDRVSVVHGLVLAAGTVSLACANFLPARILRPGSARWAVLALVSVMAAAIVGAIYPAFFLGPWPNLAPAVKVWHREIGELQPLLPDSMPHLAAFLAQLAAAVLALPLAVRRLRHGRAGERLPMLACLFGFCLFGVLSMAQMRWAGEVQVVMLLPWTLTTQALWRSELALPLGRRHIPLRSVLLMGALVVQIAPQLLMPRTERVPQAAQTCDWHAAIQALALRQPQHGIVMTQLWWGPELLWRTGFDVVGAPYEIAPALADTAIFEKASASAAQAVLARRHIGYVLTCGVARPAIMPALVPLPFAAPGFHLYRTALASSPAAR